MAETSHRGVNLYYETFGPLDHPTLLLVNGLASQCINFKPAFCQKFVDRGFQVVRFDNRDVGLSSHLPDGPAYTIDDMAADGFAVLDAVGVRTVHIAGTSMGGMIVQAMALADPDRIRSMASVMSAPGPLTGRRDPDVVAAFSAPAGTTREEAAQRSLAGLKAWGSPASMDVDRITADAYAAFDRCWDPGGRQRQAQAIAVSPSRVEALKRLSVPTLVIHGDCDRLIPPDFGRETADAIPGAHLEIIQGMGHDYPPEHWDRLVELIGDHALAHL